LVQLLLMTNMSKKNFGVNKFFYSSVGDLLIFLIFFRLQNFITVKSKSKTPTMIIAKHVMKKLFIKERERDTHTHTHTIGTKN